MCSLLYRRLTTWLIRFALWISLNHLLKLLSFIFYFRDFRDLTEMEKLWQLTSWISVGRRTIEWSMVPQWQDSATYGKRTLRLLLPCYWILDEVPTSIKICHNVKRSSRKNYFFSLLLSIIAQVSVELFSFNLVQDLLINKFSYSWSSCCTHTLVMYK